MSRKYFGTDGVRGRVGEGCITAEFVLKLGWAFGKVVRRSKTGRKRCDRQRYKVVGIYV